MIGALEDTLELVKLAELTWPSEQVESVQAELVASQPLVDIGSL